MSEFPWLQWIASTVAVELFFWWFIRRAEKTGSIERHRWPFRSERLMDRADNEERFDRLIGGWRRLMYLLPLISFAVFYLRGIE
jgi:hypothetical protein